MSHAVTHLDQLDRVALEGAGAWRPIRRALGLTAVGAAAYTGAAAGDPIIERHEELSAGAGGHEELYVVLTGSATFTIGDETIAAPAGTLLRIDVGVVREAVADEPDTTVLVVGGRPGAALPPSPFEFWYAAQPAYEAGNYARAMEIVSEGLEHYPDHGTINYQLACYQALAGDRDAAARHLAIAFARDPRTRAWAAEDRDLDGVERP
jgi:tetratricopeptide (TPR) repeat protein